MVDGYSPYLIEGLRKFDLKMRGGTSGVSHDLDLCLHKVRRLVLMLVKSLKFSDSPLVGDLDGRMVGTQSWCMA